MELETGGHPAGRVPRPPASLGRAAVRLRSLTVAGRVAYGATCVYAGVFTLFAIARHEAFLSQRDDLGNMTQAIWATLHGHFLSTTTESGAQVSRLGIHVDPFLVLLTPLWWLWSSPLLLVTLQALAVSAGAVPVFWLARKHLGSERAAAFFVFAYLLYRNWYNPAFVALEGGTIPLAEAALIAGIQNGQTYLNIHTMINPGGEIRGQLEPVPEPTTLLILGTTLTGLGLARWRRRR